MEATKKTQGKWQIMCLVLLLAGMIFGTGFATLR